MARKRQADELTAKEFRQYAEDYPPATHAPYCHKETHTKHDRVRVRYRFTCTREHGHVGPHVAHVPGNTAVAVWRDETCNPLD